MVRLVKSRAQSSIQPQALEKLQGHVWICSHQSCAGNTDSAGWLMLGSAVGPGGTSCWNKAAHFSVPKPWKG